MPKSLKFFLIIAGIIVSAWILGRITGTFQVYSAATESNEPTIKAKTKFYASNLVTPRQFDFICYNATGYDGIESMMVFRICGMEGDVVEIKKGELFINSAMVDNDLSLYHFYKVSQKEANEFPIEMLGNEGSIISLFNDSALITLENKWVAKNANKMRRYELTEANEDIFSVFKQHWTADNFGPVKVPANKVFVLGDNRHNAFDSRFQGFIDKSAIKATVLWKK